MFAIPSTPSASAENICGGSISWGVSSSFRKHVENRAGGNYQATGSASVSDGVFTFPAVSGGDTDIDIETKGGARFVGHDGQLDTTLENLHLILDENSSSATLWATASSKDADGDTVYDKDEIQLASVTLSSPMKNGSSSTGSVYLTEDGAKAFSGFNDEANYQMDDLIVSPQGCGATGEESSTTSNAESSESGQDTSTSDGTNTVTDGSTSNTPDDSATTTGEPAEPREGDSTNADAAGTTSSRVSSSSSTTAPRSTRVAAPRATTSPSASRTTRSSTSSKATSTKKTEEEKKDKCYSTSSTKIAWGVDESFRSYVSGRSAQGAWKASGNAIDQRGIFAFSGKDGAVNPDAKAGTINTEGSVNFTGKGGKLDFSITNPQVKFNGVGGDLLASVQSTDAQGKLIDHGIITLATLTTSNLEIKDDTVRGSAKPALTADGATAFAHFFKEGKELDKITFEANLTKNEAECAVEAKAGKPRVKAMSRPQQEKTVTPTREPEVEPAAVGIAGSNLKPWQLAVLSGAFIAAAGGTLFLTNRHPHS